MGLLNMLHSLLKNHSQIIVFSLVVLFFRISLSFLPAFEYDQNAFRFWSKYLAENGLSEFYSSDFFTSNPVGWLYFLYLIGSFVVNFIPSLFDNKIYFDLLLKLPANFADIITGLIIYFLIFKNRQSQNLALLGFSLYTLNPVTLFNSAVWGQYDALPTLFLIIALVFLVFKKVPELAFIMFTLAWTLKPQSIYLAPVLIIFLLLNFKPLRIVYSFVLSLITLILIYLPFFPDNPIQGIISVNSGSANLFDCTTCFNLNFWGILGNWKSDGIKFLEIPYLIWGIVLYSVSLLAVLLIPKFKQKFKTPYIFLTSSLAILVFTTFLTRMHERYSYPFFAFFLISCFFLKKKIFYVLYFLISITFLINVYIPYAYYNEFLRLREKSQFLLNSFDKLSFIFVAIVLFTIYTSHKIFKK